MATKIKFLFLVIFVVAVLFVNSGKCESETKSLEASEGRTFGHHFLKRISFALIPLMYKMGMMTTLLITLTIMSTKGLAIGVLLLILGISQIIARSFTAIPAAPIAAPLAAAPLPPPVYPVVYQKAADWPIYPVVQKALPVAHAVPTAYSGWHAKAAPVYNPYAREDTEEDPEYVNKN